MPSILLMAIDVLAIAGANSDDLARIISSIRGKLSVDEIKQIQDDHETAIGRAEDRARELGLIG